MRHHTWFMVLLALSVVTLVVEAAEKPPADYQKAMKDLGAFAGGIDGAIATEDYDRIATLAVSAREAFVVAERYWADRSSEAKELARNGGKQSADLEVMAGQKSKEGAEFAAGEVKSVCEPCHSAHRDPQPDGTFLIK